MNAQNAVLVNGQVNRSIVLTAKIESSFNQHTHRSHFSIDSIIRFLLYRNRIDVIARPLRSLIRDPGSTTIPMNRKRILFSIDDSLFSQMLHWLAERHPEYEVVGCSNCFVEALAYMAQCAPHVWLHTWGNDPNYSAMLSHAYSLLPNLQVVHLSMDRSIATMEIPVFSTSDLFVELGKLLEARDSFVSSNA